MNDFRVGDRVRVLALPETGSCAGKTGEVTSVTHDAVSGIALTCHVRLDGQCAIYALFGPHELGPEVVDTA